MIIVNGQGEYIDVTIGTALGISTLAAAALGNTISDLAGIGSAFYVESAADRIGVKAPPLTPQQLETSGARWSANAVSITEATVHSLTAQTLLRVKLT